MSEGAPDPEHDAAARGAVDAAWIMRITAVTREVLEETRRLSPSSGAVEHLRRMHGRICHELEHALPRDLYEELSELTPEVRDDSIEELALAHAEILGWLEGLLQGAQLLLRAQAASAERPAPLPAPPPEVQAAAHPEDERDPRYL